MNELLSLATKVVLALNERHLFITTVESCTGGGLSNILTNVPGASEVFSGAKVTYSNMEKVALGVPQALIDEYTVYSTEIAIAMAKAGIKKSVQADIGVGITGSFSREDPQNLNSKPGEFFISVVYGDVETSQKFSFADKGERWEIKELALKEALLMVLDILNT